MTNAKFPSGQWGLCSKLQQFGIALVVGKMGGWAACAAKPGRDVEALEVIPTTIHLLPT